MAVPTMRLLDAEKQCTTEYRFEEDKSVDLRLRTCMGAMDRTSMDFHAQFKMMSFFTKLKDAKLPEETVTRVMHAVSFLVEYSNGKDKNPLAMLALDRIAACVDFKLSADELLASAYYGFHPKFPDVAKEKLKAAFGEEAVENLEGIESVDAEQAAKLSPLAKRVKLIAYYSNGDGAIKKNYMKMEKLAAYQKRIAPIWEACLECGNEGLSKASRELFERRNQKVAKFRKGEEYSIYGGNEKFQSLVPWAAASGSRCGHPGIRWDWVSKRDVGVILNLGGTVFKINETLLKQGVFVELENMAICFEYAREEFCGLIVKDVQDDSKKPSITEYRKEFDVVKRFTTYLNIRKQELATAK